jgi:hypothetical protein
VTKHQKMNSIFIWLPLVYTTNDQLSLTKAAFNNNATALWWPSWWESATAGHNFGRGPSNDYSIKFGSNQDGHHSAVALLLKAALIQVNDYRLMGASCLFHCFKFAILEKKSD